MLDDEKRYRLLRLLEQDPTRSQRSWRASLASASAREMFQGHRAQPRRKRRGHLESGKASPEFPEFGTVI
jgi:hypothetical protein